MKLAESKISGSTMQDIANVANTRVQKISDLFHVELRITGAFRGIVELHSVSKVKQEIKNLAINEFRIMFGN